MSEEQAERRFHGPERDVDRLGVALFGGKRLNHQVEKETSKFDWVTARSSCSLPNVFKELRLQVKEDVKTRNALRPNNSPYEFSVVENSGDFYGSSSSQGCAQVNNIQPRRARNCSAG
jgi:hypothetical protein